MKILMLHGYAQNSDTFKRKMRRLEERLRDTFPDAKFSWPEGALQLHASDVPGHEPANGGEHADSHHSPELRAWFHLRYVQDPPHGLFDSLDSLAGVLERDGPFDGVVAFSQGTVLSAMVASLLQRGVRRKAYEQALQFSRNIMPFPEAFLRLRHPPFKFAVLYAGRVGRTSYYDWLYEAPPIDTPFCHFVGMWDPMVDHGERDAVLAKLSSHHDSTVIVHAGGHFAPTDNDNNDRAVEFIAKCSRVESTAGGRIATSSESDYEMVDGNSNSAQAPPEPSPPPSPSSPLAEWKRGLTNFPQSNMA